MLRRVTGKYVPAREGVIYWSRAVTPYQRMKHYLRGNRSKSGGKLAPFKRFNFLGVYRRFPIAFRDFKRRHISDREQPPLPVSPPSKRLSKRKAKRKAKQRRSLVSAIEPPHQFNYENFDMKRVELSCYVSPSPPVIEAPHKFGYENSDMKRIKLSCYVSPPAIEPPRKIDRLEKK